MFFAIWVTSPNDIQVQIRVLPFSSATFDRAHGSRRDRQYPADSRRNGTHLHRALRMCTTQYWTPNPMIRYEAGDDLSRLLPMLLRSFAPAAIPSTSSDVRNCKTSCCDALQRNCPIPNTIQLFDVFLSFVCLINSINCTTWNNSYKTNAVLHGN